MTDTRKPPQLLQIQERSETPTGYACPLCGAPIIIMAVSTQAHAFADGSMYQYGGMDYNTDGPARCGQLQGRGKPCTWRGTVKEAECNENSPKSKV